MGACDDVGYCKIKPPIISEALMEHVINKHGDDGDTEDQVFLSTVFPATGQDEWCGEWSGKQES